MILYALRRLLQIGLVLLATFALANLLVRSSPDGPFGGGKNVTPEVWRDHQAHCEQDAPWASQLLTSMRAWSTLSVDGCTGRSLRLAPGAPVIALLQSAVPTSVSLVASAAVLALCAGVPLGIVAAKRRRKTGDRWLRGLLVLMESLPAFALSPLLVLVFSLTLPLFPPGLWQGTGSRVLPAVALATSLLAVAARVTRRSLVDSVVHGWARAARARGLPAHLTGAHAARTIALPLLSAFGPAAAAMFMAGIAVEVVFDVPGLGALFVRAAAENDVNVLLGAALAYGLLLLLANLVGNLSYGFLDPRVRGGGRS
jgi:oligopeptide transport system permease protein